MRKLNAPPEIIDELQFQYHRSRGPGGQNVQKSNTAVELRWSVAESRFFNLEEKALILEKLKNRINLEQELVLKSDQFRSQEQNRNFAVDLLFALIAQALVIPKIRKKTKPTYSSKQRKLKAKSQRSEVKAGRKKGFGWD